MKADWEVGSIIKRGRWVICYLIGWLRAGIEKELQANIWKSVPRIREESLNGKGQFEVVNISDFESTSAEDVDKRNVTWEK